MWVPKFVRDEKKGIDSPMPTQVVSNEEFIPPPQSKKQAQVEHLIDTWGKERAKKLGMKRRDFMRSSMGMATAFLASNQVWGDYWEVDEVETFEAEATAEKYPKGQYFTIDVQSHFTNSWEIAAERGTLTADEPGGRSRDRGFRRAEWLQGMGFDLSNDLEAYSFSTFIKEMFFDSDTNMVVISGVPGRERSRDDEGNVLEGMARGGGGLPSWLMSQRKKEINDLAQSQRALCQGNCAPNHYWDKLRNKPDYNALFEQMEREVNDYGIDSWKWYCHTDPGRSGGGFQLDDEMAATFYDFSRKLGLKIFSVHKGFRSQSRTLGHLANPQDVEKAALANPDLTYIIYHSAIMLSAGNPEGIEFNPDTGDFLWHNVLIDIKKRNPQIDNVNVELGSAFNLAAILNPELCQHLMGKNLKYYGADHIVWGTDCLWWGSPQWGIDAMYRFRIQDELIEKHSYPQITPEDKAKILGLNAARIYGIDVEAKRNALPPEALSKFKVQYQANGGQRSNRVDGWVRAE